MLTTLAVANYRSLRNLIVPLQRLNLITGPNGSGKSSVTQFADPRNAPEMLALREQIRAWRFYDHFRTDVDAPARLPQIGTHTPVLSGAPAHSISQSGAGHNVNLEKSCHPVKH
jgi:predicted ATPase